MQRTKLFKEQIAKLIQSGKLHALKSGRWPYRAPLGYVNSRIGSKALIQVDPTIASLVRQAFAEVASSHRPLRETLQNITERGLRTTGGKPLGLPALYHLLTNRFYIGEMHSKGKVWQGSHEHLVDKQTFETVQKKVTTKKLHKSTASDRSASRHCQ